MTTDAVTEHNAIPKPHTDNNLDVDMARLALAIDLIDMLLHAASVAIGGKAESQHSHAIGDITGLQNALDVLTQASANLPENLSDLADTDTADVTQGMLLQYLTGKWRAIAARAEFFAIDAIAGLTANNVQEALVEIQTGKAEVSDIQAALNDLVGAAPDTLDTLNELSNALGNDPDFSTTITGLLAGKLGKTAKAADSDKLDGLNSSQFVRSDASDTMSGSLTVTGNLAGHGDLYTGKNGGGDSWHHFYDDNSNTWRSLGWDDSQNCFVVEENDGGFHKLALCDTQTSSGATNFPIGHTLLASGRSNLNRSASRAVYHYTGNSAQYVDSSHPNRGSGLTGTWRARGLADGPIALMQRVA
ncbi:hypothetical protein [Labrenzia sp. OB1]|uniref:hypothetical protein n=1 Tax=Labrenzia sp. OB1 TaxID=1561204 RepID=UPI0007B18179|nr:hypothetical protein [Labrenzia sp. OB1]KZM49447.1 hypothetical protein OA90_15340 [Labrenzia sp. OB1]